MKYKWLNKLNNNKLIIFFNGWGMDDYIVSSLDCGEYDVITFYDYNTLDTDIEFENYSETHVIGWSMGVMVSTLFDFKNVQSRTALCATPYPVDDKYGIPTRIYNLTVKGFSEKSLQKFMERMFCEKTNLPKYSDRTFESQSTELLKMAEYCPNEKYNFTKAIIPEHDLIIPTKNQQNFWEEYKEKNNNNIRIDSIPTGHCPFSVYKSWAEIIKI